MGRKPSIDKARLLAAAEELIHTRGAGALSFDAIAKAAGVSKSSVQTAFGTKDALWAALYTHLDSGYEARLQQAQAGGAATVDAYIAAVLGADDAVKQRVSALSVAMTQEPHSRACLSQWYAQSFPALSAATAAQRQEVLRLCALEGAMMLRAMALLPLDADSWQHVMADLQTPNALASSHQAANPNCSDSADAGLKTAQCGRAGPGHAATPGQ